MTRPEKNQTNRRQFLSTTGRVVAATTLAGMVVPRVHAAEDNTINIALVGCGGRGTGAAFNALSTTSGPIKLIAMADVFNERLQGSLQNLAGQKADQVDVPAERQFVGFDGYKKAIDLLGPNDVVLLTTPPAFRPLHLEYAVEKGVNVFMEKSFAVDAPGVHRVLAAGKKAGEKNLKVAGGLMSRHSKGLEEAVQRIHDGEIGEVITCWAYREHHPVGFVAKPEGWTEMGHQIRNYHCFTWVNGSFLLDWLIHNLDVCCWTKGKWPVWAQGQGGRQVRDVPDQLFDHYAVEYHFDDGTRLFAQGRHLNNCWGFFGDVIHGSKGCAVIGEGIRQPIIYKGYKQDPENIVWKYESGEYNAYQREWDFLIDAIRQDQPYNESERCAYASMVGILGLMASESGQGIAWDEAMASQRELAPGIADFTMDTTPPVVPDAQGNYPVAKPGLTKVL